MSSTGDTIFRIALVGELLGNLSSISTFVLNPETALAQLVRGPADITPLSKTFAQWFGGLIFALSVPLVMSFPNSGNRDGVIATRRLTCYILAAFELAMAELMIMQKAQGDSGLSGQVLLYGPILMFGLIALRGFFLYVKPEWMEPAVGEKKTN